VQGAAIALAVLLVGCTGDPPPPAGWEGRVDTLASGTIIVSNPARGLWDSAGGWTVVEDLRIGSAEGDDATAFARVRALAVDAYDRIYVLDYQAQDVRVFDRDGRHVRTVGRRGDGPGEFQGAQALALDAEGRLWVLDRQSARYSLFDTAGSFEASYPRQAYFLRTGQIWGVTPSGGLLDSWSPGSTEPSAPEQTGLFRFHPATGARDSLLLPPFDRPTYEGVVRRGSTTNRFLFPVPFTSEELLALDARGFVWRALSGAYEVAQLSSTGDTVRLVRREYQPVPVSDEDRDRALDRIRDAMEGGDLRLDPSRVPAVRPALNGFLVDDRGYLWVAPVGEGHGEGFALDVFDPDGRYLGKVSTPMRSWRVSPRALVRGAHLYYLITDSLDVPYVVRARIIGRD
jgi:hypothetical protein